MLVDSPFISDSRPIFVDHVISPTKFSTMIKKHNYDVIYDVMRRPQNGPQTLFFPLLFYVGFIPYIYLNILKSVWVNFQVISEFPVFQLTSYY